jgi:hypothetical protein
VATTDASGSCQTGFDCPGNLPVCDSAGCTCGTYRGCFGGRCANFSVDGCTPDGGPRVDAGRTDSGVPGAPQRCTTQGDCSGPLPAETRFCQIVAAGGGWSCIGGSCVAECGLERSCTLAPDLGCSTCSVSTASSAQTACLAQACIGGVSERGRVEDTTCLTFPGTGVPFQNLELELNRVQTRSQCVFELSGAGRELGTVYQYDSYPYAFFAEIPGLGGWCSGIDLPTGARRVLFSCPSCQFVFTF